MTRVLVTGGSGSFGQVLVPQLAESLNSKESSQRDGSREWETV